MYDDLKREEIIVELNGLINRADEFKNDLDSYCEFISYKRRNYVYSSGV